MRLIRLSVRTAQPDCPCVCFEPWRQLKGGRHMPEWIGTILFLAAVVLTANKINEDFGRRGELGYLMLFVMIAIYAAAVGSAYV